METAAGGLRCVKFNAALDLANGATAGGVVFEEGASVESTVLVFGLGILGGLGQKGKIAERGLAKEKRYINQKEQFAW